MSRQFLKNSNGSATEKLYRTLCSYKDEPDMANQEYQVASCQVTGFFAAIVYFNSNKVQTM